MFRDNFPRLQNEMREGIDRGKQRQDFLPALDVQSLTFQQRPYLLARSIPQTNFLKYFVGISRLQSGHDCARVVCLIAVRPITGNRFQSREDLRKLVRSAGKAVKLRTGLGFKEFQAKTKRTNNQNKKRHPHSQFYFL